MENSTLAVIVTYNRSGMLKGCLDALSRQTVACDVLVVDNASTDNTGEVVLPYLSDKVRYRRLESNLGGAGGFNAGMRQGLEEKYQYLWIMDDDAYPEPNSLEQLFSAAAQVKDDFGFLCSLVLWKDGKECRMNRPELHRNPFEHIELLQYGMLAVDRATFVSCFFKAETVRKVGLPITDFFIWGDDIEYTRRLAVREKLPCYMVGQSVVIHHMEKNTGSDISTDDPSRLNRYVYAYRNESYLYRQEGFRGVVYYLARCGLHFARIWFRGKNHRFRRSGILLKGFTKGLFFNPKIEYVADEKCE